MTTTYLNEFLQSFQRGKSDPIYAEFDSKLTPRLFRKVHDRTSFEIRSEINILTEMARVIAIKREDLGLGNTSQCHIVCDSLIKFMRMKELDRLGLASITMGDVEIDGKRLYGCTSESITHELTHPIDMGTGLDFHFWITCIDMTIIDIAIPFNLRVRGKEELANSLQVPFVYHPRNPTHPTVVHRPMVVDNDGPRKVDDLKPITG